MDEDERWLWDVQGFLRIPQALSPELLGRLIHSLDTAPESARSAKEFEADARKANAEGVPRRVDIGGVLEWERPYSDPFRELIDHHPVSSRLDDILGEGHRLDHSPICITMEKGMGGAALHGGGADRGSFINSSFFKAGKFYTGMVVVVFFLAPEGPGDGGLGIVSGSHKAELPMPDSVRGPVHPVEGHSPTFEAAVDEVHADAGDCVIFAEAVSHLTLPWHGDHQRRALCTHHPTRPPFSPLTPGVRGLQSTASPPATRTSTTPRAWRCRSRRGPRA